MEENVVIRNERERRLGNCREQSQDKPSIIFMYRGVWNTTWSTIMREHEDFIPELDFVLELAGTGHRQYHVHKSKTN